MAIPMAAVGAAADPRIDDDVDFIGTRRDSIVKQQEPPDAHGHNTIFLDSSIPFEAYHYYANLARQFERGLQADNPFRQLGLLLRGKKISPGHHTQDDSSGVVTPDNKEITPQTEKMTKTDVPEKEQPGKSKELHANTPGNNESRYGITETEWERAQRQSRTATWLTIFYLITTDILGPYSVPYAFAQLGYGPGMGLYVAFGIMAFYSGLQLWRCFCGLDSPRYPMRNYGDLGFRLLGKWARLIFNILQSGQFFLNVTLIIESSGQGLQQMAAGANGKGVLCFVVAEVIFTILGFLLGQIRTLQRLGYLANLAVWLNVFVIIMTMIVVPVYGPNEIAAHATYNVTIGQPVQTYGNWPPTATLYQRFNGILLGVFAYGGATIFNELMAEMRRPFDFWKGFVCAEIFIFSVYITMGLVVYSYQGQYAFNPAYQGIPNSAYAWQTVGNAIAFVSSLIAALLYGNIGVKVFYAAVLRDVFRFPALDTKKGKWTWPIVIPIYWILAWIVAAAVPQISYIQGFTGAAFILQFSYTFPPLLMVAYNVQKDAMLPEEVFDPITNTVTRVDGGWRRFVRGFLKKPFRNSFDCIYFLAALAVTGLGLYASGTGMQQSFAVSGLTSFTCQSPTGSG